MSVKISKKELKGLIGKLLSEQLTGFNPAAIRARVTADNTPAPAPARKRTPPARAPEKSYAEKLRDALNQEIPEAEGEITVTQDPNNPNHYEVSPLRIVGTIQPEEEEVKAKVNQAIEQEPEVPEAQEVDIRRNPETGVYEMSPIVIFGDPNAPDEEVADPIQKPQPQRMPEAVGVNEQAKDPKFVDDKGNPITVTRDPKTGIYHTSTIHIVGNVPNDKEKKPVAKQKQKQKPVANTVNKPKAQLQKEEEELNTPEKENDLYESRFSDRNTKLFEKLLKEWTK